MNKHLSYPSSSAVATPSPPPSAQPRPLLKDRLYIGNLHPTVDEYTLLQAFSKFGKVSKLDYLFHKTGPLRGKPRGYAFIEYAEQEDAQKALNGADGKLLRGRKLVVTYAHQAPLDEAGGSNARHRRPTSEAAKPTTLSLMKSVGSGRSDAVDAKIARMEAKLRQLEHSSSSVVPSTSSRLHPSLPPKPLFSPTPAASSIPSKSAAPVGGRSRKATSSLPMKPLSILSPSSGTSRPSSTPPVIHTSTIPSVKKTPLLGVKIVKKKG
ncbi:hypothetical protein CERSUDRAFT_115394 [Gelatoporia subvermispora B]|uniref:Probable RNA-binding protein 18 n=1 Tax=Ceriporiopsis subvermispora (strain B) TaxID=914234 RepID=M2PJL6_CERS8|nr:hypothetical protein CERSUDRAFT_115394 [Gelatoporia subvermispora B]